VDIFGAKVSRQGFDVRTCADQELLYSSEFPLLKLHESGTYTIVNGAGVTTMVTHNLGYFPVFTIFNDSKADIGVNTNTSSFKSYGKDVYWATTSALVIDNDIAYAYGARTIRYNIYRQDMFTAVDYGSILTTASTKGATDNFGIKVAKEGKSINSSDYRDFAIHSSLRSLLINKVIVHDHTFDSTPSSPLFTEAHGLTYPPLFLSFEKMDIDDAKAFSIYSADGPFFAADNTNINAYSTAGQYNSSDSLISFVVFKDPINSVA